MMMPTDVTDFDGFDSPVFPPEGPLVLTEEESICLYKRLGAKPRKRSEFFRELEAKYYREVTNAIGEPEQLA
jgi:hypothetical protein